MSIITGAYIQKEKKFYYIEGGKSYIGGGQINRLKKALLQRRLIDQEFGRNYKPDYIIMSIHEAKENGYEIVPIYLSKHIQDTLEEEKESGSSSQFK